jgi:hypothetical protein
VDTTDPLPSLRDLLATKISAREAAHRLVALSGPASTGLALGPGIFTAAELERLTPLMAAVRWEMAKLDAPGRLPDVPYDSPEYHLWLASVPTERPADSSPAG